MKCTCAVDNVEIPLTSIWRSYLLSYWPVVLFSNGKITSWLARAWAICETKGQGSNNPLYSGNINYKGFHSNHSTLFWRVITTTSDHCICNRFMPLWHSNAIIFQSAAIRFSKSLFQHKLQNSIYIDNICQKSMGRPPITCQSSELDYQDLQTLTTGYNIFAVTLKQMPPFILLQWSYICFNSFQRVIEFPKIINLNL